MRNARRATTVSIDDAAVRSEGTIGPKFPIFSPRSKPPIYRSDLPKSQGFDRSGPGRCERRPTFASIVSRARLSNIVRLKDRAFAGNRTAKLVSGASQSLCYGVKNRAISALLKHRAASLHSLEVSGSGPILGVEFIGGGRLHVKHGCLDGYAQGELQAQFTATLQSGSRNVTTQAISSPRVDDCLLPSVVGAAGIALISHFRSGGATVSLSEGNLAGRKLFSVAIYPERTIEFKTPPTWEQLFAFATAKLDLLLQPDHALGTWFDRKRGFHTLDVVICLVDRDEAIRLGEHFHQSAIFDLAAGRDIFLAAHQTGHVGVQR
jgi:hypothetical protein